jgi:UDP-glucuronate decarboxylase
VSSARPSNSGRRFLVTGGAGFIGRRLCQLLLDRGDAVLCLDNFRSSRPEDLAPLLEQDRFQFLEADVCTAMDAAGIGPLDGIFNLASPASPPDYQRDPIQTFRTNVIGVMNLAELARGLQVPLLQASTSEVYGDPQSHPQREDYWGHVNPIGLRSCYDEGKRAAETLLFDYKRCHGVTIRVARIFNTYGPGMRLEDGRVVSNFIAQALQGQDLQLFGGGRQTRSFCYRDDTVDGLLRLMDCPEAGDGPVNLGNPAEFTVAELAHLVIELTGTGSRCIDFPLPSDDPRQRCPDIERARRLLNWEPKVSLREGLMKTIPYFKQLIGQPPEGKQIGVA